MAVMLVITFTGGTEEQYRAVHSHMRIDENAPPGLIFHSAGPIDGGWRVVDFWESRAEFDKFLETGFGPAAHELGDRTFRTLPDIVECPVSSISKP